MTVKLPKRIITNAILSRIKFSNLGRKLKVPFWKILQLIVYRLKTGYKGLLVRFEKLAQNWTSLHYIAFIVILIRKVYF